MYGKSFESMFEGSMVGAGLHVFAVWSYIITKAKRGFIEINPKLLAFTLGGTEAEILAALDFLQQPDPNSRSKLEEGRRLVKDGQFQYRIVNWEYYDQIRNEIERRDYNRIRKQQYRKFGPKPTRDVALLPPSVKPPVTPPATPPPMTPPAVKPKPESKFQAPTLEDVKLVAAKIGLSDLEAEKFFNHYTSNGWKVGKNQMKSWPAALSGWKLRSAEHVNTTNTIRPITRDNPRNAGIAQSGTDYGKSAKAKLERQRLEYEKLQAENEGNPGVGAAGV